MAVQLVLRERDSIVESRSALTDRGSAAVALLRFERLFRELGPADRRWFAGELAGLAEEAEA
jgi:hypothetical protein